MKKGIRNNYPGNIRRSDTRYEDGTLRNTELTFRQFGKRSLRLPRHIHAVMYPSEKA